MEFSFLKEDCMKLREMLNPNMEYVSEPCLIGRFRFMAYKPL